MASWLRKDVDEEAVLAAAKLRHTRYGAQFVVQLNQGTAAGYNIGDYFGVNTRPTHRGRGPHDRHSHIGGAVNLDDDVTKEDVCEASGWAFAGTILDGKVERDVPIGTYSSYDAGKLAANLWMKSTPKAVKWTGWPMYQPVDWSVPHE